MKLSIPTIDVDDDRAVSPVIGVILMVAITVILAAVIGAFVLNLGQSIGQTTPRASLSATDAGGNNFNMSVSDNFSLAYLNHQTGDDLPINNLKFVVKNEDGNVLATLTSTNSFNSTTASSDGLEFFMAGTSLGNASASRKFTAGDQIEIKYLNRSTSNMSLSEGETITIQVVDTKSGGTVATTQFTIN